MNSLLTDDGLRFIINNSTQYDPMCRELAAQLLKERELAEASINSLKLELENLQLGK